MKTWLLLPLDSQNCCSVSVGIRLLKLYLSDAEILLSGMIEIFLTVIKTCEMSFLATSVLMTSPHFSFAFF